MRKMWREIGWVQGTFHKTVELYISELTGHMHMVFLLILSPLSYFSMTIQISDNTSVDVETA